MAGGGFNQTYKNNPNGDLKNANAENNSLCATESGDFTEKHEASPSIKTSANDGLDENATPDDVLSLIDY